jgi:hypothetical protein
MTSDQAAIVPITPPATKHLPCRRQKSTARVGRLSESKTGFRARKDVDLQPPIFWHKVFTKKY